MTPMIDPIPNPHEIPRGGFGFGISSQAWPWWLYNAGQLTLIMAGWKVLVILLVFSKKMRAKLSVGWKEKLGCYSAERLVRWNQPSPKPRLWLHAVSVGEVNALRPLITLLANDYEVWLSTTTATGQVVAKALTQELCGEDRTFYAPWDLLFCVASTFAHMKPALLAVVETELWPNWLLAGRLNTIPMVLINGRLSPKSYRGYRWLKWLMAPVLRCFSAVLAQSVGDAERLTALGAANVTVMGNLKWDYSPTENSALRENLQQMLGIGSSQNEARPWIVIASTRGGEPLDEEAVLLPALATLKKRYPALRFVLAVRHPERGDCVATMVQNEGLSVAQRSQWDGVAAVEEDVVILDTIGELTTLYRLMDLAVMGGSFIPHGGQNPLEPLAVGIPTLVGPCMTNFAAIEAELLAVQACEKVASADALVAQVAVWLENPEEAKASVARAQVVLAQHKGASQRVCNIINPLID
ncbi:MAG: 3-deoxy-D-manno-octulosonic acid transferase [Vampirovibrionales bacterium]|nr:3-deoxy-D-manno-octulosonic acid transferase [Vampirovibrionales bacterium]